MKVLFSWVGHADLLGFGYECPEKRSDIQMLINKNGFSTPGPIKTAISEMFKIAGQSQRGTIQRFFPDNVVQPFFAGDEFDVEPVFRATVKIAHGNLMLAMNGFHAFGFHIVKSERIGRKRFHGVIARK